MLLYRSTCQRFNLVTSPALALAASGAAAAVPTLLAGLVRVNLAVGKLCGGT
jgi:hypothetical protein